VPRRRRPYDLSGIRRLLDEEGVLAYSGGLDTSVAVAWLREQYDVEVVTLTVDLGAGVLKEDVDRRAIGAGASRAYVVDGRERFVRDFCCPTSRPELFTKGGLPAGHGHGPPDDRHSCSWRSPIRRRRRGCPWLHGQGNDQVRFDIALTPSIHR